jgi:hypothetical protein
MEEYEKIVEENALLKKEIHELKLKIIQQNEYILKQFEINKKQYLFEKDYLPYDEEDNYR